MKPPSHNSHPSHPSYQVGVDPGDGDSWSARQWHDNDGNIICQATESEVAEIAEFYGYTTEQFEDLRPKIQVGMIRDHRRQMRDREQAPVAFKKIPWWKGEFPMSPEFGPLNSKGPTFGNVIVGTMIMAAIVTAIIYALTHFLP